MTTKTMDGEEYIKKSDVKTIISRIENINIAVDSWEQIEELPTINFSVYHRDTKDWNEAKEVIYNMM